ncbi:MAG: AraC family transcriptional regulator [Clostridia bacterium]|nr:AraC family transcriptional regulator [Clostridia bacterium]
MRSFSCCNIIIACATGFDNPGYFISVFRRAAGMTPKAYREMMQENT